jgi:chromosomal replication initiation ATPase DnaA
LETAGTIQEWIEGFEKEINRRFKTSFKVVLVQKQFTKIDTICEIVSGVTNIPVTRLRGKSRDDKTVDARQIAMYLCRHYTKLSLAGIGRWFNRDHSTVIYSIETIQDRIFSVDATTLPILEECEKKVKQFFSDENNNDEK